MTAPLKPYLAYKDSGVPWLGMVPEHWGVRRLKNICSQFGRYGANLSADNYVEAGVRFIRTTDLTDDGHLKGGGVFLPPKITSDYLLSDGDLLISRSGTIGRSFLFKRKRHGECAYAGYLVKFTPSTISALPEYLLYFTKSTAFGGFLRVMAISSTIDNVNAEKYSNGHFPCPPLPEQLAIVRYLDYMDRRIGKLIRAKQKLVKLLEEQKQAIIHRAVTRGLDPNVRLKPSGVEWLGDMPEHWEVRRLKTHLIRNDSGAWGSDFDEAGTIVLRSTEQTIDGGWRINNPARRRINEVERQATLLRTGDIVVTKSSGSAAHIGKASLVSEEIEKLDCGFSNFMQRLRPDDNTSPDFVWRFMNNRVGRDQLIYFSSTTTGLGNLNGTILGNIWIAFPTLDEQIAITNYIEEATASIAAALERANREIELLREYRTRLISDVVTGKLDVRKAAAGLPEEAKEEVEVEEFDELGSNKSPEESDREEVDVTD